MKKLTKKEQDLLDKACDHTGLTEVLQIDMWNQATPHFGGCGPHRYDDGDNKPRPFGCAVVHAGFLRVFPNK